MLLGSADLMARNLDHRVETVFPIEDESQIRYLRDTVLETYLRDNQSARDMTRDGTYVHLSPVDNKELINVQEQLMKHPHGLSYE